MGVYDGESLRQPGSHTSPKSVARQTPLWIEAKSGKEAVVKLLQTHIEAQENDLNRSQDDEQRD